MRIEMILYNLKYDELTNAEGLLPVAGMRTRG